MDGNSQSAKATRGKGKSVITRRTWTTLEEQSLIQALKDIVALGWKCDNSFKTGYLATLENALATAFPGTDLKAEPHIHSKIHVWKKNYGSLSTMLSRSGFGWNDSACTIGVLDDQVWTEYVKSDAHTRTMRYKAWSYWVLIFGKDRATGENAEAFAEAVNELQQNEKGKEPTGLGGDEYSYLEVSNEATSEFVDVSGGNSATSSKSKGKSKKKRVRNDDVELRLVDMMSTFFEKADNKLGRLVEKIRFEYDDISESRKRVFDALAPFNYLDGEHKLQVTKTICESTKIFDIFFSVNDKHKALIINMILQGRF